LRVPKIRVLIVDDAVTFRRLVADELARDPALEVVGTASNGHIALARMTQVNPDVVILDVEMPEMDGLTTLKVLRKTYPRLPVIMFSALTMRGAEATLDALAAGATDYFTKPASAEGLEGSLEVIREALIPQIKVLCERSVRDTRLETPIARSPASHGLALPHVLRHVPGPVQVLAIGASTGGPNALAELFRRLPADFPVPIVIVQHMPPMFTRLLAERLSVECPIPVEEASSGAVLQPGKAWIAPGDFHMVVVRDGRQVRLQLHQDPPENSCRPAVDVLLRSLAQVYGPNSLSVILTGMGQDGLRGCNHIREAGGQIVVQDEASSVVWGMPGSVARAGLADRIMPLALIADEILRRVQQSQVPS
jgi:two-component system, chemotaxis family, protein-glutamate methylesterase/glutaminase